MNPVDRLKIDNLKEILAQIERLGKPQYIPELEEVLIREIAYLVSEGTETAREELRKLEKIIEELDCAPRHKLLVSAMKNSIKGALSVAKLCLF